MSKIEPDLRIGLAVFAAASRFDDNNDDRWLVAQFETEADTEELIWHVGSHRAGRWKLHVLFENTYVLHPQDRRFEAYGGQFSPMRA
jgi:hypothetical protein